MDKFIYKIYIESDLVCEVRNLEYVGMIVSGIFAQYHGTRDVKVTIFRLEPASTMRSE